MEICSIWAVCLCFLLVGEAVEVEVEASHDPHRNLQSLSREQPYRTAFHFQPPQNWMNGMSTQHNLLILSSFNFILELTLFFVLVIGKNGGG